MGPLLLHQSWQLAQQHTSSHNTRPLPHICGVVKVAAATVLTRPTQFGVYHLALHHATVNAADDIKGTHVHDAALVKSLLKVGCMYVCVRACVS